MSDDELLIDTIKYKDHIIKIYTDQDPISPREWDNLGTMVCFHHNYNLGDKHDFDTPGKFRKWEKEQKKNIIILAIHAYEHNDITIKSSPYTCPWDSGQVGWIYILKNEVRKEFNWSRITEKRKEKLISYLNSEIETYDQYLNGDIYGYVIEGPLTNDSCMGYYGLEDTILNAQNTINDSRQDIIDNPKIYITFSTPQQKSQVE